MMQFTRPVPLHVLQTGLRFFFILPSLQTLPTATVDGVMGAFRLGVPKAASRSRYARITVG